PNCAFIFSNVFSPIPSTSFNPSNLCLKNSTPFCMPCSKPFAYPSLNFFSKTGLRFLLTLSLALSLLFFLIFSAFQPQRLLSFLIRLLFLDWIYHALQIRLNVRHRLNSTF